MIEWLEGYLGRLATFPLESSAGRHAPDRAGLFVESSGADAVSRQRLYEFFSPLHRVLLGHEIVFKNRSARGLISGGKSP